MVGRGVVRSCLQCGLALTPRTCTCAAPSEDCQAIVTDATFREQAQACAVHLAARAGAVWRVRSCAGSL
jgi:hypothetical protein